MADRYKITFDGRLNPDIPPAEIRENLLRVYQGDQRSVDLFFSGKRLIVNKNLEHSAALKRRAAMEQAGIPCRVVRDEPPQPQPGEARPAAPQQQHVQDFSFRGIIAESWGLIYGIKGEIVGAVILAAVVSSAAVLAGYGITRFMGEAGRSILLVYAFQYGFGLFGYPFLAGPIILGAERAAGREAGFGIVLRCLNRQVLLLSLIISIFNYLLFAALYSGGMDHFYARASGILTLPVFALTVPLVSSGMNTAAALGRFSGMLRRHFGIIAALYAALACINLFGNFVIVGFIWTAPLLFVASGVLFRNLVESEREVQGHRASARPRAAGQPVLEGSAWQNVLAAVLVGLFIAGVGARLWALQAAYRISLPDHVAANSTGVCIHADKTLHFLSPDGATQRTVPVSALGLQSGPADLELLEDGSLLVGDADRKTILRCPAGTLTCRAIGPPNPYQIADNFKFLADEKRGLLFIADTNNHRIIVQDLEGTRYRALETRTRIDYPNDMALDEAGMLWVSNTLHERVLCFRVDGNTATETGTTIVLNPLASGMAAVGNALLGSRDRRQTLEELRSAQRDLEEMKKNLPAATQDMLHARPMALAWGADGNLWVAASDPVGTSGGVRVFGPEGKQVQSIHLDRGAIPEDIIRLGDQLLIADPGLFQIFAAQASSGNIFPFGDHAFQAALADTRHRLELYEAMGKWSKLLLWVLGFATAALVLVILRTRRRAAGAKGN